MNGVSKALRKELDRLVLPYVHTLLDEIRGARQSVIHEAKALRASLADEARGVREAVVASVADETNAVRASLADEARGVREAVIASLADEARGVREAVVASVADECRAVREESRAQQSATATELTALRQDVGALRGDIVELTRMLRMQGDASDQVAEVMGRTLTRLSAEVEALAEALNRAGVTL
jgi:uncharacterized membrane protein